MKLFIIGNGFDIGHGLPTQYWDFRKYLENVYPDFLYAFEEHYYIYPRMADAEKAKLLWNELETNFCKNLETVWCKNQVDRIGIQTFGVTPMERLCVNAKNIDISAFAGMESLKEIHIRGGVEHMSLGAFAMLPSIETICLEGIDPDVMEDDWANLGNSNLTILVPEDTSDEQLEAIGRKFLSSMIITDGAQVKRGTCSMPEDPMPDIAEMLSAYGI